MQAARNLLLDIIAGQQAYANQTNVLDKLRRRLCMQMLGTSALPARSLAGDVRRRREHRQAQVLQEERDNGHSGRQALQIQAGPRLPDALVVPVQAVKDGACRVGASRTVRSGDALKAATDA